MLCYFIAWFDLHKTKRVENDHKSAELPETEYELNGDDTDSDDETDKNVESGEVIVFRSGTCIRKRHFQKILYTHITPLNKDKEEHFREKLMLYTHWRNESLLINGYSTYEKSYEMFVDEINRNRVHYERCDLDDGLDFSDIAFEDCNTRSVNMEAEFQNAMDMDKGITVANDYGCFDPGTVINELNYDLGEDICANVRCIPEPLPQNEIDDHEYFEHVRKLNFEQKKFFYHILHSVKMASSPFYIFLSGGAGVGKSVLVRCIYQGLLKFLNHQRNEEPDKLKVLLCAPTGKAAHNIGGSTIHSAFCIPASQGFNFKPLDMQQLNTLRSRYYNLKIVINEISMVGRGMMNFINLRLQEITGCVKPFGGLSILAVGDLYQLKPVMDSWIFSETCSAPSLATLASNLWVELFDLFELYEIMRQKDDLRYAELLNRLREGIHTEDDISVLMSRMVESSEKQKFKNLPHLYCTKKDVFAHNHSVLDNMDVTEKVTTEAVDDISSNVRKSLRGIVLSKVPSDSALTTGLQKKLTLGIGLAAEISLNIDTEDGLTNGSACIIKKFDFRVPGSPRCSVIWVEFDEELTGRKCRLKYRHLYNKDIQLSWTPILETCRKFSFKYYKSSLIARRQFPIYVSAGKTIHKAQGSTLKEAVMHFGTRKTDHIHYVGLSRVTSLSGAAHYRA